jgi:hypothetical protein
MFLRSVLSILGLSLAGTANALAAAHALTYVENVQPLGTEFSLGGRSFVLVRIPIELFSGERYSVIVPFSRSPDDPTDGNVNLQTEHSTDPFDSNLTIDSYPARVVVEDVRSFGLSGDFGESAFFTAVVTVQVNVTLKLGTTLVTFGFLMDKGGYETEVDIGPSFSAQPFAEWSEYRDPTGLVGKLNDLIDYVRVLPL